jgi:hypothetical protein
MTDCPEPFPPILPVVGGHPLLGPILPILEPLRANLAISCIPVLRIRGPGIQVSTPSSPPIMAPQIVPVTPPKIRLVVRPQIVPVTSPSKPMKPQIVRTPPPRLEATESRGITDRSLEIVRSTVPDPPRQLHNSLSPSRDNDVHTAPAPPTETMTPRQRHYYDQLCRVAIVRGYKVLGSYVNTDTPISMLCPNNHTFLIRPITFKHEATCYHCISAVVYSKKDFYDLAIKRHHKVLGAYTFPNHKIQMQCPKDHIFEMAPLQFMTSHNCIKCLKQCPIQAEEEFRSNALARNYQILGSYVNANTKVKMRCPRKHVFEITPSRLRDNTINDSDRCCSRQPEEELHTLAETRGYKILGPYLGTNTNIEIQCPNKHIRYMSPHNFKAGRSCAVCSGRCPLQARDDLYSLADVLGYKVIGLYVNTKTPIEIRCPNNHVFSTSPSNFKKSKSCGVCKGSTGEKLLHFVLGSLKLSFESQYILSSLPGRSYDFVIFLANQHKIFIEWDGVQHFEHLSHFHQTQDEFLGFRAIDIRKTQEVINAGSKILRIDYTWLKKPVNEIAKFIMDAIGSDQCLIISDPSMYIWLTDAVVIRSNIAKTRSSIRLVIKPRLQSTS